jgi:hypothetical protein
MSKLWLEERLHTIGISPRNAVVNLNQAAPDYEGLVYNLYFMGNENKE